MANFFKATKKAQLSNQPISVRIDKLDHNGVGVGAYKGKAIFVQGSLPNERVTAKILASKNKYIKAQLIEIKEPSPDRIEPFCRHFHHCGGCDLQHLSYQAQLAAKQQKVIELFGRSNISYELPWQAPITSEPSHYRRKARIGVQFDKAAQAIIGFRKSSTNQLVHVKSCPVLVTACSDIFPILNKLLAELSGHKAIGHIEVIATETLTLVVRQLQKISEQDINCWQRYAQQYKWQIYIDDGEQTTPITDIQPLSYILADNSEIHFQSDDFIQVNAAVNQQMITTALEWLALEKQDSVLDLFCGLGNFSLPIAKLVSQVVGVEGVVDMVERAQLNAQKNALDNCSFYQANLNANWLDNAWAKASYSHIVLDPARAGAFEAIPQVVSLQAETILYVSCDPQTLARDSELFIAHGYKIEKIMLMDMFSQTKHIETMVLFTLH